MALIDPADIPEFEGNLAIIRYNAEKLQDVAKDVPSIASGAVTTYRTLYNVYSAPEADQLVSSLDPILTTSNDFGTGLQSLSRELLDFVEEMREVDNRLSEMAAKARNFRRQVDTMYENGRKLARATQGMDFIEVMKYEASHSGEFPFGCIHEGKSWNTNQNLIATNNWIGEEVAKLVKRFFDVQIKYANRIAALCNGRKWNPETGQPDGWTIPLTPEQQVDQLVKGLFGTPTPTWAQPEEWDRPMMLDVICAPGELVLETLDMVTTLTGMQWALREMGVTSIFGHQMADMYATKDAWVGLGKTFAMIVGELASVNPMTDAGFKAIVGKDNAADLHRFGVEWAHGMVEDWKRNPAKAILGAAVSVVPIGGGLAALRTAGMASKIKPIAAVSRGAQKIVDFKAGTIGKTLDLLHIPRVKDVVNGRAQVPLIEMPQHIGIDSRGGRVDIPDGRPTVPHNQPGEGLPGINDRPGQQLPTTHQRPTETVPVEQRPVDHRPVEQRPVEQSVRTPNDRGGPDTTHQHPGDDGRPVTRPEDRPGRPGDRHQEHQPVNPVMHQPVDRTGTTRVPDRTGTPTTETARTHDRGGPESHGRDTSTGHDRQPDRSTESRDRNPADRTQTTPAERHAEHGRDEKGRDEKGRDEKGRDESGREQTRTRHEREQTPTQHQHERETQPRHERESQPTSHGRDREPAPAGVDRHKPDDQPTQVPPVVHTGAPGGHSGGESSISRRLAGEGRSRHPDTETPRAARHSDEDRVPEQPERDWDDLNPQEKTERASKETSREAVTFWNDHEARAWGERHWDDHADNLPASQKKALNDFSLDPPHKGSHVDIGRHLRRGEEATPEVKQAIREIDKAMADHPVPEDVVVVRGANLERHFGRPIPELVGKELRDPSYVSTSLGSLHPIFSLKKEAIIHLRVPKGTPAIYMRKLSAGPGERELVLGRNLPFRLNHAVHHDGKWHVYAEILPTKAAGRHGDPDRVDQSRESERIEWPDRDPDAETPPQRHGEEWDPASDISRRLSAESTAGDRSVVESGTGPKDHSGADGESDIARRLAGEREKPGAARRPDADDPEFDWFTKPDRDGSGDTAPPATYKIGEVRNYRSNEARWITTAEGHPRTMEATLRETHRVKRDSDVLKAQQTVRTRGHASDDAGHGVGHRFFPDQGVEGMFPQNKNFNRGAYKRLENEWANWIDQGHEVRVRVTPLPPGRARPDELQVTYEVVDPTTGKTVWANGRAFFNSHGEAFTRHPNGSIKQFNPGSDLFDVDTGIPPTAARTGLARKPEPLPENAVHQGTANQEMFRQTFPELTNVNPMLGSNEHALRNCQAAVDAAETTLRGGPSSAVPGHPDDDRGFQGSWKDRMISRLGVPGAHFQRVAGYSEIVRLVSEGGDGTRAVVYGARRGLNGLLRSPHIFMVVNRGGKVHFVDPQIHSWADLQPYNQLQIMRTN